MQTNSFPCELSCVSEIEELQITTAVEDSPVLELKELSKHLFYACLDDQEKYPIIISSCVSQEQKDLTLQVLKTFKKTFSYRISNISGIDPSFCSHRIVVEKEYKSCVQPP